MPPAPSGFRYIFFSVFALLLLTFQTLQAQESYEFSESKFHISGEGGGALFHTGPEGEFPNDEFRVDEARLFVEAAVWDDVYVFGEVNLLTREAFSEDLELGELYVQFENVSKLWNQDQLLNVRLGRFDIPFGEEYLTRDAIDNPLISHSLSDLWGIDEGIEAYGSYRWIEYVFAVQNGGDSILHDFTADKSISGRITLKATPALHFSFSGMRTGEIDAHKDQFAALWFGNRLLSVPGSTEATTAFRANVFEGDGHFQWQSGHLHVAGGRLDYRDDNTARDLARDIRYFQTEAIQNIASSRQQTLYGGVRFSKMTSAGGFPIIGNADADLFYGDYIELTDRIWNLAFGLGYRIGRHVLLKTEYNIEHGRLVDGSKREKENFFGAEAAFKF